MNDLLFKSTKAHSDCIADIMLAFTKHATQFPEVECLVYIKNGSESVTYTNVKNSDAIKLVDSLKESYHSSTALPSSTDHV